MPEWFVYLFMVFVVGLPTLTISLILYGLYQVWQLKLKGKPCTEMLK